MPGTASGKANNSNAMRHGLRAGNLPKGCAYILKLVNEFRRSLESAVMAGHGEISLTHAALIHTACRWERHALLAQRWLRDSKLDADQRLAFSREIPRASSERDKCLKLLQLDRSTRADVFDVFYSPGDQADESEGATDGATSRLA